jgi:uncharacterized protein YlxW (UPF0749 family)
MASTKKWFIGGLIGLVLVAIVAILLDKRNHLDSEDPNKSKILELQEENKKLESTIVVLKDSLEWYNTKIRKYATQDSTLNQKVMDSQLAILKIEREYEKLRNIDHYTVNDISEYFANLR